MSASAVYATFAAAALSAAPLAGAAMGAVFGLLRAATLLAARRVRSPAALHDLGRKVERWRRPARGIGLAAQAFLALLALGVGL